MKKKLIKQKRRLFIFIASSLLVLSLIVFSAFAVITYNSEKELLTMNAYSAYFDKMRLIADNINGNIEFYEFTGDFAEDKDTQIIITDEKDNVIAQSENAISVSFYNDDEELTAVSSIKFDDFRNSMTDEQYKKITEYLTRKKTKGGKYYILSCSQYYAGKFVYPKRVDILLTDDAHSWYVQDELVERFELNPVIDKNIDTTLENIGQMNRNIIDTNFVLGKYEREDLIGEIATQIKENYENSDSDTVTYYSIDSVNMITNNYNNLYSIAPFTYIFYEQCSLYYNRPTIIENNYEYTIYKDDYDLLSCNIKYAHKFNVLESCINRLILMFIYIFGVFLIVGVIIGAVTWHTLKKQIIQEHQLRTITNSMAHELKTPLFVIGGYAENLIENINTDKQTHYANVILEKSKSINRLVSKMLDYSKLDWTGMKLNTEQFNLTEMTQKIINNYFMEAIDLECDKDVFINADKRLIKSAVENLIDNAVKYTTVHGEIKVTITNGLFTVSNPFESVTKTEIDGMWQPYNRQAEQSNKPGHGLGLAIVKSIFNLHKFKYGATYSNGKIVFWFKF